MWNLGTITFSVPAGILLAANLAGGMQGGTQAAEDEIVAVVSSKPGKNTSAPQAAPRTSLAVATRPDELGQAEGMIHTRKFNDAEVLMMNWIKQNSDSAYLAQAYYLQGQAQFYQKKFEVAKKTQDFAVKASQDTTTKALAMFARADCNFNMGKYSLASQQYHWVEQFHRDVTAIPHDELLFKIGISTKLAGFPETADYWFNKVIELYSTGKFAREAKKNHSQLGGQGEGVYYRLGAGIFSDPAKAKAEVENFKKKGYRDVEIQSHSFAGSDYYEVTLGKFFNKLEAKVAQEDADLVGLKTDIRPFWGLPDQ